VEKTKPNNAGMFFVTAFEDKVKPLNSKINLVS
jgi:hypothetical protein